MEEGKEKGQDVKRKREKGKKEAQCLTREREGFHSQLIKTYVNFRFHATNLHFFHPYPIIIIHSTIREGYSVSFVVVVERYTTFENQVKTDTRRYIGSERIRAIKTRFPRKTFESRLRARLRSRSPVW